MKKNYNTFAFGTVLIIFTLFTSCGSSVKTTPEMEAFLVAIDSTNSMDDAAAIFEYSTNDMPLGYYEVKEPTVVASIIEGKKTCYHINVKHAFTSNDINVCWEEGKIVSISNIDDVPF